MNLIALSDIHSDLRFIQAISEELVAADVVLIAGDITNFGGATGAREVIEELRVYNRQILAVPGNCDGVDVNRFLATEGISLHGRRIDIDGVAFGGVCHWLDCKCCTLPQPRSWLQAHRAPIRNEWRAVFTALRNEKGFSTC